MSDPTIEKYAEILAGKYYLETNETDVFQFLGRRVLNLMQDILSMDVVVKYIAQEVKDTMLV